MNRYMLVKSDNQIFLFESDGLTIQEYGKTGIMGVDRNGDVVFLIPIAEFHYLVKYDGR